MSEFIGEEQFRFLHNRQIHDEVTVAQEKFHYVKHRKLKATLLKLDLTKSHDRANWTFLRLTFLQLGLNLNFINWIMGCLHSVSFDVLINGVPLRFFKASWGLRQGCSLSLFLFLIIEEALSRLLNEAKHEGFLKGIKVTDREEISHL
jgi:hypothetical protein